MNILFMYYKIFDPTGGGVERVTDLLCREFQKRGHNVAYLCNFVEVEKLLEFDSPAPVYYFPCPRDFHTPEHPANIEFYNRFLATHDIDIIIIQDSHQFKDILSEGVVPWSTKIISVLHNNPTFHLNNIYLSTLYRCCNLKSIKRLPWELKWARDKRMAGFKEYAEVYANAIAHSDAFCLLSINYLKELRRLYKGDTRKIIATSNPNTYTAQPDTDLTKKKKQLLYVGRLEPLQKRVQRIVEIWQHIYRDFPDWELIIVGEGPQLNSLKQMASQLERITFAGRQNPEPYYRDASIFCMTSEYEGWGMVLTEAMTFGTIPILFDSFLAASEIIEDGKTGMLIRPFSLRQYELKLRLLMTNTDMRKQMAIHAIEYVKRYDITYIADKWESLFNNLKSQP